MLVSKKEKFIIIGAGLTGLSTAYHLKDNYTILEKERTVGGLCRTLATKGFNFDYSGHLLHLRDPYVIKLVHELLDKNFTEHHRQAFIYYLDNFVPFPFQANLLGLPESVVKECLFGLIESKCAKKQPSAKSFEEWIILNFGKGFYKHFFAPYNEKLFGTSLKNISSEWCDWFVPKPNIEQIVYGAFDYQHEDFGYNTKFLYPNNGGIQALPSSMANRLKNIQLNTTVDKVYWKDKKIGYNTKLVIEYDSLVSTMPLPELVKKLDPFPTELESALKALKWRSVHCLNIGLKRRDSINRHWVYYPENQYMFYRVGFIHNFSRQSVPHNCSSMYVEIATDQQDISAINKLFTKAIVDLNRLKIINKDDTILALQHMPMPYAYVTYDFNRTKAVQAIMEFLNNNFIYSIGRYGGWKYSFMEEAILDGKNLAEKLIRK